MSDVDDIFDSIDLDEIAAEEAAAEAAKSPIDTVYVDLSVELGSTMMPIHELLRLGRGAVIALDSYIDDDVTVMANDIHIADGELQLLGESIRLVIKKTCLRDKGFRPPEARMRDAI